MLKKVLLQLTKVLKSSQTQVLSTWLTTISYLWGNPCLFHLFLCSLTEQGCLAYSPFPHPFILGQLCCESGILDPQSCRLWRHFENVEAGKAAFIVLIRKHTHKIIYLKHLWAAFLPSGAQGCLPYKQYIKQGWGEYINQNLKSQFDGKTWHPDVTHNHRVFKPRVQKLPWC